MLSLPNGLFRPIADQLFKNHGRPAEALFNFVIGVLTLTKADVIDGSDLEKVAAETISFGELSQIPESVMQDCIANGLDGLQRLESHLASDYAQQIPQSNRLVGRDRGHRVFIGHGRSKLWARVSVFLTDELGLEPATYESESRTGKHIVAILDDLLDQASFAVVILTGEDETKEEARRARQNVIHETGLFQGRLGFNRAVLLIQEGVESFTNVAGLQHIPFSGESIEQTFNELRRVLKREGLIEK